MKLRLKIVPFLQICLAFLLILNGRTMYPYLRGAIFPKLNTLFWLGTIITGLALIALKIKISKKHEKFFILGTLLLLYFSVFLLFQNYERAGTIRLLAVFFVLLVYYYFYESKKKVPSVLFYYKEIIFILSVFSLILWLGGSVLHIIPPFHYTTTSWSSDGGPKRIANYYYLYFECQTSSVDGILTSMFARNTSVFTEGPMASLHFSLAFLIEALFEKNKKNYKIAILFISIVTSLSSTGIILGVMYVFLMYIFKKSKNDLRRMLKFCGCFILSIVSIFVIIHILTAKSGTGSGRLRVDDYIVCFRTWIDHPIFGNGIGNQESIVRHMDFWRLAAGTGLANSPGQILAHGGLWIFSLYAYAIVKSFYYCIRYKDINKLVFVILFSFIFMVTIISYSYLTFMIFIWFGAKYNKDKINIKDILYQLKGNKWLSKNLLN